MIEEDLVFSGRGERVIQEVVPSMDEQRLADTSIAWSDMPSIFLSE